MKQIIPIILFRILCVVIVLLFFRGNSISQDLSYFEKAKKIGQLAEFVYWPKDNPTADSVLHLKILGENHFGTAFEELYSDTKIGNYTLATENIIYINQIENCDMLFISDTYKDSLDLVIEATRGKSALLISDIEGSGKRGIHINFYPTESSTPFEINEEAVKRSGLGINHLLLKVVRIVKQEN